MTLFFSVSITTALFSHDHVWASWSCGIGVCLSETALDLCVFVEKRELTPIRECVRLHNADYIIVSLSASFWTSRVNEPCAQLRRRERDGTTAVNVIAVFFKRNRACPCVCDFHWNLGFGRRIPQSEGSKNKETMNLSHTLCHTFTLSKRKSFFMGIRFLGSRAR